MIGVAGKEAPLLLVSLRYIALINEDSFITRISFGCPLSPPQRVWVGSKESEWICDVANAA